MLTFVRTIAAIGLVLVAWLLHGSRSREPVMRAPIVRLAVKHPWLITTAMATGAIVVGAALLISGVVPIGASSGHWTITAALLDFAKTRSVATHSWGINPPSLGDDMLVLRGGGHYESACVACHGGPGRSIPPVMMAMTPSPPLLADRIARWAPEELFSIVKHGIKFTGMPGWPVQQRDDEVWAMVAFLRRLPDLDGAAYRRLVFGELSGEVGAAGSTSDPTPQTVRNVCWRCHGIDGTGRGRGAFPSLAGQRAVYIAASLRAFRERTRSSGIMGEVAAKLNDTAIRDIAAYYERLPSREPDRPVAVDASRARGGAIAAHGIAQRDVPACVECHGPADRAKNPAYPQLASQHAAYLMSQLSLLQERRRGGTAHVNLMHIFVNRLRDDEIQDVARYYAAIPGSNP